MTSNDTHPPIIPLKVFFQPRPLVLAWSTPLRQRRGKTWQIDCIFLGRRGWVHFWSSFRRGKLRTRFFLAPEPRATCKSCRFEVIRFLFEPTLILPSQSFFRNRTRFIMYNVTPMLLPTFSLNLQAPLRWAPVSQNDLRVRNWKSIPAHPL